MIVLIVLRSDTYLIIEIYINLTHGLFIIDTIMLFDFSSFITTQIRLIMNVVYWMIIVIKYLKYFLD